LAEDAGDEEPAGAWWTGRVIDGAQWDLPARRERAADILTFSAEID
jgi:hypothetical protein